MRAIVFERFFSVRRSEISVSFDHHSPSQMSVNPSSFTLSLFSTWIQRFSRTFFKSKAISGPGCLRS